MSDATQTPTPRNATRMPLAPGPRKTLSILAVLAGLALITLFLLLPVFIPHVEEAAHESPVHEFGQSLGLVVLSLLFVQILLSGRIRWLDRIFGLNRLLVVHRWVAVTAGVCAILHPLFMFAPADETIGPLRLAIWPELLGAATLIGLWFAVGTGLYRAFLRLPYNQWFFMHRNGMVALGLLALVHPLFAADLFQEPAGQGAVFGLMAVWLGLAAWVRWLRPARDARRPYTVARVQPVAGRVHTVELAPPPGPDGGHVFDYAPGQFAFVRFRSAELSGEEHHFTLSSSPTRPGSLIYTIACSGDFTSRIGALRPGDTAVLHGPFGLFNHLAHAPDLAEPLVMVAAGIGITPMLSMLRYMADREPEREVALVWSNRTSDDVILPDEFAELQQQMPGLRVQHVFTREPGSDAASRRLDAKLLDELLAGSPRTAHCFVCGPEPMMDEVVEALKELGFSRRRIHTERFAL